MALDHRMGACKNEQIFRYKGGQVSRCSCGIYSLSFDNLSVRMQASQFQDLAQLVGRAAAAMLDPQAPRTSELPAPGERLH